MENTGEFKERLQAYNLSERTRKEYLRYFKRLKEVIGDLEINEEIANAFLKDNPNSVCMAFLNNYIKWNRLNIYLEDKIVKRDPQKQKRYISPQEIKVLAKWLKRHKGIKYKILLRVTYDCALRKSESVGLKFRFLKEDYRSWKKGDPLRLTIHKESAKRKKQREAVLSPYMASLLKRYIILNKEKILETNHENDIFRVTGNTWHKVFKEAVRKGLKKDYTLHELRFSKATFWWKKKRG